MEVFYCVTVVGIVAIVALVLRFRFAARMNEKEIGFTAVPLELLEADAVKRRRKKAN